jgi:hypothetical protein
MVVLSAADSEMVTHPPNVPRDPLDVGQEDRALNRFYSRTPGSPLFEVMVFNQKDAKG